MISSYNTARYTSATALLLSAAALAMSSWALGCRDAQTTAEAESVGRGQQESVGGASEKARKSPAPTEKASPRAKAPEAEPKSAAAPEPEPPRQTPVVLGQLKMKRLVVTHAIEKREPVETKALRANGDPIYAFVEMENLGADEAGIVITFEHSGGREVGHVKLGIPGKQRRWRTWGRTRNIRDAGEWTAVVRSADGQEIARAPFEVRS